MGSKKQMNNLAKGRWYEYLVAKILWENYGIVSFPAPTSKYDLITLAGVKIEVKSYEKTVALPLSDKTGADFWVVWLKGEVFVVPAAVAFAKHVGNRRPRWIYPFKNRWDLIVRAEHGFDISRESVAFIRKPPRATPQELRATINLLADQLNGTRGGKE